MASIRADAEPACARDEATVVPGECSGDAESESHIPRHEESPASEPPAEASQKPPTSKNVLLLQTFLTSGSAVVVATAITHPIDVVKVQQQLQAVGSRAGSKSMISTAQLLLRQGGPSAFFRGFQPAVLRAASYGSLRLGLYDPCKHLITPHGTKGNAGHKVAAGLLSGVIATAFTNPLDVAKVRLQLNPSQAGAASETMVGEIARIGRSEGVGALWKGVGPSMGRAAVQTASQVAVYDECKHMLKRRLQVQDGLPLHLSSSMLAGVVVTATTSPFDTVKSRMMAAKGGDAHSSSQAASGVPQATHGRGIAQRGVGIFSGDPSVLGGRGFSSHSAPLVYRSSLDCALKILKSEGVGGLYKGWAANYTRMAPQTAITFVVYEQLRQWVGMPSL